MWERIPDISFYDSSFERIVAAIYGISDKPSLGSQPAYVNLFGQNIDDLSNIDSLVLKLSCEEAVKKEETFINPDMVFFKDNNLIVPREEFEESLEILDSKGYIKLTRIIGGSLQPYQITNFGFESYANESIPNYQCIVIAVASVIVNEKIMNNIEIQKKVNEKKVIVDHILDQFENSGHIKQAKMIGGGSIIVYVLPSLKRTLNNS